MNGEILMSHEILLGLAAIIIFGITAQWIAWRFKLPSILLLLIFGFVAGPISGLINPDKYFGTLLFPIVSVSVAIILFEGGLSLKLNELKAVGSAVRNLIIIGIPVTLGLITCSAYFILNLSFPMSLLMGSILVVTGPTVILPLLRQIKPTAQLNTVLKWEGIINDPIGALLAILVFEGILAGGFQAATAQAAAGFFKTVIISTIIGLAGAYIIVLLLKYKIMPDFLHNPVTLSIVIGIFALSNIIQSESGLFAVTVSGIYLANQKEVTLKHIVEFKENLRVLLISVLFIMLSARIKISDIRMISADSLIFVASLIIIIRPLAVLISTFKTSLNWKEKLFISWMAPRGIVAAAVSSLFAIELLRAGYNMAEELIPITFLVIIVTITVYGISSMPLAKWMKLANPNPHGCLILGAHSFGRAIGKYLKEKGFNVLLIDTNRANISLAKMEGLATHWGSVLSEEIINDIDLNGIGNLLSLTPNGEVNSLACLYFSKVFGSSRVYQLSVEEKVAHQGKEVSKDLRGQILFGTTFTFSYLLEKFDTDLKIGSTKITAKFNYEDYLKRNKDEVIIPMFLIDDNELIIYTKNNQPDPKEGQTLISLVKKKLLE